MTDALDLLLFVLFGAHLVAFVRIGLKKKEVYYLALVATFSLLTLSFGIRIMAPDWQLGPLAVHEGLRYLAWMAAAVSISWTAFRWSRRRE